MESLHLMQRWASCSWYAHKWQQLVPRRRVWPEQEGQLHQQQYPHWIALPLHSGVVHLVQLLTPDSLISVYQNTLC